MQDEAGGTIPPLLTVQNGEEVTVPPANAIANYHAAPGYSFV